MTRIAYPYASPEGRLLKKAVFLPRGHSPFLDCQFESPYRLPICSTKENAMSAILAELQAQAKQLGAEERAQLASFLLDTLEPADSDDVSQAWKAEINTRWAEIERGEVELIPATEVFADLRRKLS
jgi:putative addiction module component (TIGR02574 family)